MLYPTIENYHRVLPHDQYLLVIPFRENQTWMGIYHQIASALGPDFYLYNGLGFAFPEGHCVLRFNSKTKGDSKDILLTDIICESQPGIAGDWFTYIRDYREALEKKTPQLTDNWWEELGDISKDNPLPHELSGMLRDLITAHEKKTIEPHATPELIKLAKRHLANGIVFKGERYEILVFVPENEAAHRRFFRLSPRLPGKFKELWAV